MSDCFSRRKRQDAPSTQRGCGFSSVRQQRLLYRRFLPQIPRHSPPKVCRVATLGLQSITQQTRGHTHTRASCTPKIDIRRDPPRCKTQIKDFTDTFVRVDGFLLPCVCKQTATQPQDRDFSHNCLTVKSKWQGILFLLPPPFRVRKLRPRASCLVD